MWIFKKEFNSLRIYSEVAWKLTNIACISYSVRI